MARPSLTFIADGHKDVPHTGFVSNGTRRVTAYRLMDDERVDRRFTRGEAKDYAERCDCSARFERS